MKCNLFGVVGEDGERMRVTLGHAPSQELPKFALGNRSARC